MTTPELKKTFKTPEYRKWEAKRASEAAARIDARIKNLQHGFRGDWASVGEGVCELRFLQTGRGWRVYFHETNAGQLILLLLGGDKSTQKNDIKEAKRILKELKAKQVKVNNDKKDAAAKAERERAKRSSKSKGSKK